FRRGLLRRVQDVRELRALLTDLPLGVVEEMELELQLGTPRLLLGADGLDLREVVVHDERALEREEPPEALRPPLDVDRDRALERRLPAPRPRFGLARAVNRADRRH